MIKSGGSGSKSQSILGKPQGSRGNAYRHYAGLDPLPESSVSKNQDTESASELPAELAKSYSQLPTKTPNSDPGAKQTSFWERVRAPFSCCSCFCKQSSKQSNQLDRIRTSSPVKKPPPVGPLSVIKKGKGTEGSKDTWVKGGSEREKGGQPSSGSGVDEGRRKGTKRTGSRSPGNRKISDPLKPSLKQSGEERSQSHAEKKHPGRDESIEVHTKNRGSPSVEPQGKQHIQNTSSAMTAHKSGKSEAVAGPSWLGKATRSQEQLATSNSHDPLKSKWQDLDDTFPPADPTRPVVPWFQHQPTFQSDEVHGSAASEASPTVSDQTHPAYATFFRARTPLDPHGSELIPNADTDHSGSVADLDDLKLTENQENNEERLHATQQIPSQQQSRYPGLASYATENGHALSVVPETAESRRSSMALEGSVRSAPRADHQESIVVHPPHHRPTVVPNTDAGPLSWGVSHNVTHKDSATLANGAGNSKSSAQARWPFLDLNSSREETAITSSDPSRDSGGTNNTDVQVGYAPKAHVTVTTLNTTIGIGSQRDGLHGKWINNNGYHGNGNYASRIVI